MHKRTPSMMLAWFRESLMMASSGPSSGSKTPPLASKQAAYRMVSSVPWKAASFSSSSLWMSCVPQMKRTLLSP